MQSFLAIFTATAESWARSGWAEFGKAIAPLGALKQQTVIEMKPTAFSPVK